jgi:hypothetical protein
MKTILAACAGILVVLFTGCAHKDTFVCSPFANQKTFTTSSGQKCCALHQTPLVTTNGFILSSNMLINPGLESIQISQFYPNHIGFRVSLNRREPDYVEPDQITYCPQCDAEYRRAAQLCREQNHKGTK